MSADNLPRKGKEDNQNQGWKNFIPFIIFVVVSILIWAGFNMGAWARKGGEAFSQNVESVPFAELTIDSLPPVVLKGKSYKVIVIDSLAWLAENLNYDVGEESLCFDNDTSNCNKYGRLYTYEGAMQACQEIGWRLPTKTEWDALKGGFGNDRKAYAALIKGGKSGFDGVLGGSYSFYDGKVEKPETIGSYWSSTEIKKGAEHVWKYALRSKRAFMSRDLNRKKWALSCRCVKLASTIQLSSDENTILD